MLWFTVQNANRIGRLDPKSGGIKLLTPAHAEIASLRHGIRLEGALFRRGGRSQQRRQKSIRRRCKSASTTTRSRSAPAAHRDHQRRYRLVHRLRARVSGRLIRSGKVIEWQSPSGPKSEPYGISAISDILGTVESGNHPEHGGALDPRPGNSRADHSGGGTSCATPRHHGRNFVLREQSGQIR